MSDDRNPAASPEFEFLLACAGSDRTRIREKLLGLISRGFDWGEFFRVTKHHRLIPPVCASISEISDLVPPEIREELRRLNECNVRHTLRLTHDLIRVVKHFESRSIPVLAYKGPVLATMLYGDFTQRQYSDLDLLIHPCDVQRSKLALAELEYSSELDLSHAEEKRYVESANEFAFHAPDRRNVLELQWKILPRFYSVEFDIAGFFGRAITVEISGYNIPTLCHDDLVLVLCVHAAKHAWADLSLVSDIAKLVGPSSTTSLCSANIPSDLPRASSVRATTVKSGGEECRPDANLFERARQLGILRILDLNFRLAHELLGAPLRIEKPAPVLANREIASLQQSKQIDTQSMSYFRLMLSLRERWQDKVRFLWRLLTTPSVSEWETLRLPPWLSSLYRVVRIYRLTARFWRSTRVQPPSVVQLSEARHFEQDSTVELRPSVQPGAAVPTR